MKTDYKKLARELSDAYINGHIQHIQCHRKGYKAVFREVEIIIPEYKSGIIKRETIERLGDHFNKEYNISTKVSDYEIILFIRLNEFDIFKSCLEVLIPHNVFTKPFYYP